MLSLVGMLAVAYGGAFGSLLGWLTFAGGAILTVAIALSTSPVIAVDSGFLSAGSARLPRTSIESARALTGAEARTERSTGGDVRRFVLLRTWSSPSAVLVTLNDPDDPHPGWLLTSRHPNRLAAALQ